MPPLQIMYGNLDRLFDGNTGQLSAIIRSNGVHAIDVIDFNNDGNDEILSVGGNNRLKIYSLINQTGIENPPNLPFKSSLLQNYPNPFNARTAISYNLISDSPISLTIHNILGQRVATLFDGIQKAGEHRIIWDAADFASGIYFYRLKTQDFQDIRKMSLIK